MEKESIEKFGASIYKHYDITLDDLRIFTFIETSSIPEVIDLYQSEEHEIATKEKKFQVDY